MVIHAEKMLLLSAFKIFIIFFLELYLVKKKKKKQELHNAVIFSHQIQFSLILNIFLILLISVLSTTSMYDIRPSFSKNFLIYIILSTDNQYALNMNL